MQSVKVVKGKEYLLVHCHFVEGSTAKGCHVVIQVINAYTSAKIETKRYNIPRKYGREDVSSCLDLEHQTAAADVNIYDWEEDGTVGSLSVPPIFEKGSGIHCM